MGEGGLAVDLARAVRLFQQSAAQGDADALFKLGIYLMAGDVIEQDQLGAVQMFTQAAQQGTESEYFNCISSAPARVAASVFVRNILLFE
jgi:TPR repeat protein